MTAEGLVTASKFGGPNEKTTSSFQRCFVSTQVFKTKIPFYNNQITPTLGSLSPFLHCPSSPRPKPTRTPATSPPHVSCHSRFACSVLHTTATSLIVIPPPHVAAAVTTLQWRRRRRRRSSSSSSMCLHASVAASSADRVAWSDLTKQCDFPIVVVSPLPTACPKCPQR